MNLSFVNRKDRIVASAIEIISESGIESLSTRTLAMKENMSESLLYRYFGGIDEVLVEVVLLYTKFDDMIIATLEAKDIKHYEKVLEFIRTFATYYDNYIEITAIAMNYEAFLHNVNTRDVMTSCISKRKNFIVKEFRLAIENDEISNLFTPDELAIMFLGIVDRDLLNRRIELRETKHSDSSLLMINKIIDSLLIKKES